LTEASVGSSKTRSMNFRIEVWSWTAGSRWPGFAHGEMIQAGTPRQPNASTQAADVDRRAVVLVVGEDVRRRVPGRRLAEGADQPSCTFIPSRTADGGCSSHASLSRRDEETLGRRSV
jgi:hypothetical protein